MKDRFLVFVYYLTFTFFAATTCHALESQKTKVSAIITTNLGTLEIELFKEKAPKTVDNFIAYATSGFYNDTVFHRVIPNFMIQGGGFTSGLIKKDTQAPIKNEAKPFVPNSRGTIAMARTSDPDSATAQFFINVVNNKSLNKTANNAGYAVFGKVTKGMIVADQIALVKTSRRQSMGDVPVKDVVIKSITIKQVTHETTLKPDS